MKIRSTKYRAVIIGFILFLSAVAYAGTCEFRCVYCALVEFAGCNQPAPNNGYSGPMSQDKIESSLRW